MSTPLPLTHGNYLGTLTIGPASTFFVPFRLLVELSSFPNGFLQLSTLDGSFFGGGTISVAVQNGSLALSINTVVCNVFDPNAGTQTDLKDSLTATALIPNTFTHANWVVLAFSNNSKSPSSLSISIDPVRGQEPAGPFGGNRHQQSVAEPGPGLRFSPTGSHHCDSAHAQRHPESR